MGWLWRASRPPGSARSCCGSAHGEPSVRPSARSLGCAVCFGSFTSQAGHRTWRGRFHRRRAGVGRPGLESGRGPGPGQGATRRAPAAARRCRRGSGEVASERQTPLRMPEGLHPHDRPVPRAHWWRGVLDRGGRVGPCGPAADQRSPPSSHGGHRDAARRRRARRGGTSAPSQEPPDHGHLRESRSRRPVPARPPVARRCSMTILREALADYLRIRESLGYKVVQPGRVLGQFVAYLETLGLDIVTTDAAVAWATQPHRSRSAWCAVRYGLARGFAGYLKTINPETEVPPAGLVVGKNHRATPYLYSDAEVCAL